MSKMLRGNISGGMFPDERTVTVRDSSGADIVVVAPAILINGNSVRVQVIESREGNSLVLLPGDVFGAGQIVTVRDSDLADLPAR